MEDSPKGVRRGPFHNQRLWKEERKNGETKQKMERDPSHNQRLWKEGTIKNKKESTLFFVFCYLFFLRKGNNINLFLYYFVIYFIGFKIDFDIKKLITNHHLYFNKRTFF